MLSTTSHYKAQRAALINEDRSLRREFLQTNFYSDKEREADKILRAIRASEAATIWNEEHISIPHPFPGMEFLTGMWVRTQRDRVLIFLGKPIIMKTKIFEILSKACHTHLFYRQDFLMTI
jgi:adenosine deaminase CECR1